MIGSNASISFYNFDKNRRLVWETTPREKENKEESLYKTCIGTLSCDHSPFIYRHWLHELFTKPIIIVYVH